uniref:Uncharacterized protein n=1 Tax=viral metagenome TaxID=1070528 RepID=A0A6C0LHH1_9ZZZZ
MAVTFTKEFYINFGLFLFACLALVLSIWAFSKRCKKDKFGNINDLPPGVDIKASTSFLLPSYRSLNIGQNGKPITDKEKEEAQSLLYINGYCIQCYQFEKNSKELSKWFSQNSFNDKINDPDNILPANNLINLGINGMEFTSNLPCDTLTRLRKRDSYCN